MEVNEVVRMLKNNEGEYYDYRCYVEIKDGEDTWYGEIEGVHVRYMRDGRIMSQEEAWQESQENNINFVEYGPVVVIGQYENQNVDSYYL